MIRIAIFDDNKARRESLQALLALSPEYSAAGCYENCDHILEHIRCEQPQLLLMDIEMPGTDGIKGLTLVKQQYPHIKIIMQTAFDDDDKVFAAIRGGAEGYILKSASVLQIKQSIDEVMNGGASMSPSIALKVMRYFSQLPTKAVYDLSNRETEVLKHLAAGLSYKMIAHEMAISYFTVNNHVKKVYEKLHVHSLGEAVALAYREKLL